MKLSQDERRDHLIKYGRDVGFELWGSRDYAACAKELYDRFCLPSGEHDRRPFVLVGNSLGGHIAPIMAHALQQRRETKHMLIDRAFTIGSAAPYSGWFPKPEAQFASMRDLRTAIEKAGYLNLELAGLVGRDLPRLAALDWVSKSRIESHFETLLTLLITCAADWCRRADVHLSLLRHAAGVRSLAHADAQLLHDG